MWKNGLQNGLKCLLRDIDFENNLGGGGGLDLREGVEPSSHTLPGPSLQRSVNVIVCMHKTLICS